MWMTGFSCTYLGSLTGHQARQMYCELQTTSAKPVVRDRANPILCHQMSNVCANTVVCTPLSVTKPVIQIPDLW